MIKYALFLCLTSLFACIGKHQSEAQVAEVSPRMNFPNERSGDTSGLDISKSRIFWRGTKMRGTGKHEGEIKIKEGFFVFNEEEIVAGVISVDMHSIVVTDIPESEPIPLKKLTNHLKSADFFDVKNYSISIFEITSIERLTSDSIKVSGILTIKDISKSVVFNALDRGKFFSAKFTIDRFQWNIGYKGSWQDKTLVDKEIELTIELVIG